MKEHTSNFETEIKTYGRQQAVQVIYEQDGQEIVLDNESVFSATPNFKASLLKSAMKSLILDCSVEIPVGTRLQFKYGVLVGNEYEYLNFGYYIVNKVEKKEDARSYEMTCYDKMMLTMVDYIDLGIEYPITVRNYIAAICNHLEIDFGSNQDQFVNYDKEIEGELYLDENGDSLDYTFRDVLDELSQATASVICIDENDQLVVKYPQRQGDYETLEGTSLYIENADDNKIDLELKGNTTQNGTPTPSSPVPVSNVTGLQTITISNGTDSKDYEINLGNIELNKIGNYQDFIRKGTGKNLINVSNNTRTTNGVTCSWNNNFVQISGTNTKTDANWILLSTNNFDFPDFKIGETYTISALGKSNKCYVQINYNVGDTTTQKALVTMNGESKSFIVPEDFGRINFIFIGIYRTTGAINENWYLQLEKGPATSYEPYGYKNKWYIEKNVGKVVLDGSPDEFWIKSGATTESVFVGALNLRTTGIANKFATGSTWLCNKFTYGSLGVNYKYNTYNGDATSGYQFFSLTIPISLASDINAFRTWLASNPVTLYYVLANPTYTLIENEELIEQLDRIHLEQGLNNVMVSSSNLPSSLKMTYVSNLIGIDEDSLKDINVNFGEKYGPINSLVIARAADSDFIYKEDEQSVAEDGLCEVKISDNQILNDDNRTQFIDGMFNQLRGTEFYLNDFSSTGIAYLDLLDYYKIKVFDNTYKCLMLNDELDITQGLQEQIFTDRPKESETEYKSLSKEGKDIRKTMILVDKVNGRITTEIADVNGKYSTLSGTVEGLTSRVQSTETAINGDAEDPNNPGLIKQVTNIKSTMLTQEDDAFTAVVSQAQTASDGVKAYDEDDNLQTIRKQIVFDIDGLTISANGTTSDDMKLHLTNAAIEFLYQNHAILTINGSTIEFSNASFKKLDLGNYVWQAEDDGSLSLIWEGGNI